ncbi:MAG: LysE family translocator [Candidatus Bathyarchaeia archaeon]
MVEAVEFLLLGAVLGLVQGLSPGPLVTLVISETLKFGKGEGYKVALSPLITDSVVVVLALVVLSNLAKYTVIISGVSILGACYLVFLGVENLRVRTAMLEAKVMKKEALKRAVITNFLNPHVYVFWISVGGPIILRSLTVHVSVSVLFLFGFFVLIVSSKASIAYAVDRSKAFVRSDYYSYIVRALGIVLILFALILLIEGWCMLSSV